MRIATLLLIALALVACDKSDRDDGNTIPALHARVTGIITNADDGTLLEDVALHAVYITDPVGPLRKGPRTVDSDSLLAAVYPNPFIDTLWLVVELPSTAQVRLWVTAHDGDSTLAVPMDGQLPAGRHAIPLAKPELANDLYDVHATVDDSTDHRVVLKNTPADGRLRAARPLTLSATGGRFSADIAVGEVIVVIDSAGRGLGITTLRHLDLIAIKAGYHSANYSLNLDPGDLREISLQLRPE